MMTPEHIIEAQKANLDALINLGNESFNKIEKAVELNLNAVKSCLEESGDALRALSSAKDAQDFLAISSSLGQPATERAVSYGKDVYQLFSSLVSEMSKKVEEQVSESNKRFVELFESASKNAPAGSESVVAMMKSAITAANSAYDSMSKATKQATEMAEANVEAATKATIKAASTAANAAKPPRKVA